MRPYQIRLVIARMLALEVSFHSDFDEMKVEGLGYRLRPARPAAAPHRGRWRALQVGSAGGVQSASVQSYMPEMKVEVRRFRNLPASNPVAITPALYVASTQPEVQIMRSKMQHISHAQQLYIWGSKCVAVR